MTQRAREAKVLVLGGVEAVAYGDIAGGTAGVKITHVPHVKRFRNAHVGSYDGVICLMSEVSHCAVKRVKQVCRRYGIPIYYLRTSGGTHFRCALEDICGGLCPNRGRGESDSGESGAGG